MRRLVAAGADAAKQGWVVAARWDDGSTSIEGPLVDAAALIAWRGADDAPVGIDIPIGLVDGARACDGEARAHSRGRAASVFTPPARWMLELGYGDVRATAAREGRRSLSAQAFGILPRIADVDRALRDGSAQDRWLFEVHPEVSFARMCDAPLGTKTSMSGVLRRLEAVREHLAVSDVELTSSLPAVDVLDACAVLWTALRFTQRRAETLGNGARDALGRPLRIVV